MGSHDFKDRALAAASTFALALLACGRPAYAAVSTVASRPYATLAWTFLAIGALNCLAVWWGERGGDPTR